jgi:Uma2 family endonuclease
MPTKVPRHLLHLRYFEAEQEYLRSLPPEHFMEATPQATQRKITVESFDLITAVRPEVQVFNELLVQYERKKKDEDKDKTRLGQVVPDNMVVLHNEPIKADGSFNLPLQPVGPFLILEYVSKNNKRKDYDDNMLKYEHEIKVQYYLLFQPDVEELTLYRHNTRKYVSVKPNDNERYAIPELELEVALLDGWVRYWFRGELLPLPGDLLEQRDEARQRADAAEKEVARLRAELARMRRHSGNGK